MTRRCCSWILRYVNVPEEELYSKDKFGISIDDGASQEKVTYKFQFEKMRWLYFYFGRSARGISQKRNSESRIGLTREIAKILYNIAKPFPRMHADMICKCDRIDIPFIFFHDYDT